MKSNLLVITVAGLVAASIAASAAFNYAQIDPRAFEAAIVQDDSAYLALAAHDTDHDCFVSFSDGTYAGEVHIKFDNGDGTCAGTGTGVNPDADTWFYDVLAITNKGTKSLTAVWVNSSSANMKVNLTSSSGAMQHDTHTFQQNNIIHSLAVGSTYYIGVHVDTTGQATGTIAATLSFQATE